MLTDRETATVLAALRYWQDEDVLNADLLAIATDGDRLNPLTDAEVDILCERLNQPQTFDVRSELSSETVFVQLATRAGWDRGGDNGGFWFDANRFATWKEAASADDAATYATARELCQAEGLA